MLFKIRTQKVPNKIIFTPSLLLTIPATIVSCLDYFNSLTGISVFTLDSLEFTLYAASRKTNCIIALLKQIQWILQINPKSSHGQQNPAMLHDLAESPYLTLLSVTSLSHTGLLAALQHINHTLASGPLHTPPCLFFPEISSQPLSHFLQVSCTLSEKTSLTIFYLK